MELYKFPREFAINGKRQIVWNLKNMIKKINAYNGYANLYTSVYNFTSMTKDFNDRERINYESAIVDRVFADFDKRVIRLKTDNDSFMKKFIKLRPELEIKEIIKETKIGIRVFRHFVCTPQQDAMKLHQYYLKNDWMHFINMSGNGYHPILLLEPIYLKNKKDALINFLEFLEDELKIIFDPKCFGKLDQIYRLPNTWNMKADTFCINLNPKSIDLNYDEQYKVALNQNKQPLYLFGHKRPNLFKFDTKRKEDIFIEHIELDIKEASDLIAFPDCIKRILLNAKFHCPNQIRTAIITFHRDMALPKEICRANMQKYLTPDRFYHSEKEHLTGISEIDYYYKRQDILHPNCKTKKQRGLCKLENQCGFKLYY
jgi:hypothetical protein